MEYFLANCTPEMLSLMAISLTALKIGYEYTKDKFKYDEFSKNSANLEDQRIVNALKINKKSSAFDLKNNQSNSKKLENFISDINASLFHYSGNCALLSTIVMYNFLNTNDISLAAKNTYPIMEGISQDDASEFLLGQTLTEYGEKLKTIEDLENKIIECYEKKGEKVFSISASGYKVPFVGETGHCFNAVVLLDKDQKPTVQFVDAWKTSNYLPSKYDLEHKYSGKSPSYQISFCENKELIKNFSEINFKKIKKTLHDLKNTDPTLEYDLENANLKLSK